MRNPPFSDVIPESVDASVANWGRVVEEAQKISIAFDHQNNDKPFTIVDLNTVRRLHTLWKECMPSVKPYYAVKCNNDKRILKTLLADGCAFDCASQGELEQVFSLSPKADIIFAHPVKTRQAIRFAAKRGIHLMTFDTIEELLKMSECDSEIRPVLRIQVSGFSSLIDLNEKFGADEKTSMEILRQAAEMNIPMAGISFHIGSGVEDYHPMEQTLAQARKLIDYGRQIGHPMEILDIGGGIIFQSEENLTQLGVYMEDALRRHFEDQKVKVIAEPGRFFVSNCQYAVAKVIGVAPKRGNEQEFNVYINDGVYGSFNFVMTEYREAIGYPLKERNGTMVADIWGITACALDRIEKNRTISLLKEGDWLIYPNNGAYSNVLSTEFNGFPRSVRIYLDSSAESEDRIDHDFFISRGQATISWKLYIHTCFLVSSEEERLNGVKSDECSCKFILKRTSCRDVEFTVTGESVNRKCYFDVPRKNAICEFFESFIYKPEETTAVLVIVLEIPKKPFFARNWPTKMQMAPDGWENNERYKLRTSKDKHDFHIICTNGVFYTKKRYLQKSSNYFKQKFASEWKDVSEIKLDISVEAMRVIAAYLSTNTFAGPTKMTLSTFLEIREAIEKFDLPLMDTYRVFICYHIFEVSYTLYDLVSLFEHVSYNIVDVVVSAVANKYYSEIVTHYKPDATFTDKEKAKTHAILHKGSHSCTAGNGKTLFELVVLFHTMSQKVVVTEVSKKK